MRHALQGDARKWGLSIAQQKDYMRQSGAELFSPLKGGIQGGALRLIGEEASMLRLREEASAQEHFVDVCLVDSIRAIGFKVPYLRSGPLRA